MDTCKANPYLAYEVVPNPGIPDRPAWGVARLEPRLRLFGRGLFWKWRQVVFEDDSSGECFRMKDMLVEGL
jgi:hypothetical protein